MEAQPTSLCHMVAMPFPVRGNINPMMNLCKLLVSNNSNIHVTFVVTEEWLSFISSDPIPDNISFRSIPNVIPSELIRSRDHPAFMEDVMTKMEAPFEELLDQLYHPPSIIVYDTLLYWAVVVANRRNIPATLFWPMPASIFCVFQHQHLFEQNGHYPVKYPENGDKRVCYIPGISSTRLADFALNDDSSRSKRMMQYFLKGFEWIDKAQYLLFSSIYELESQAIDVLKSKLSLPIYTIGPTIPNFSLIKNNPKSSNTNHSYYIEWLDSQPIGSVLYIAQGSFFSVSSAQIDEIVAALCSNNVWFVWIARSEASRLKEICGGHQMGLVLEWCDQLRVLSHPSIGGFWSHCGWNSTKESLVAGVPFLTSPIYIDQPFNSKRIGKLD